MSVDSLIYATDGLLEVFKLDCPKKFIGWLCAGPRMVLFWQEMLYEIKKNTLEVYQQHLQNTFFFFSS